MLSEFRSCMRRQRGGREDGGRRSGRWGGETLKARASERARGEVRDREREEEREREQGGGEGGRAGGAERVNRGGGLHSGLLQKKTSIDFFKKKHKKIKTKKGTTIQKREFMPLIITIILLM
jgi:hypothetical protein